MCILYDAEFVTYGLLLKQALNLPKPVDMNDA